MFRGLSTVDVSLDSASGNIDSLWSTKHTVSFGLSQQVLLNHRLKYFLKPIHKIEIPYPAKKGSSVLCGILQDKPRCLKILRGT